ncbi:hypothetical protein KXW20_001031 [Aspergillus fumigatus]|nr:hypothetical protein KXW20_001031 [Aspergillus fumigatus]
MFLPPVHAETDTAVLLQFIRENPLGLLITGIKSSQNFLQCTHVPFVLDTPEESTELAPKGRLRAHIAKKNPQVTAMIEGLERKPSVLDIEDSVLDHYVTPKYYVETKPDTGKVVPTWNYSAVQVYGKLTLYYDSKTPEAGAFLAQQIDDLSQYMERAN